MEDGLGELPTNQPETTITPADAAEKTVANRQKNLPPKKAGFISKIRQMGPSLALAVSTAIVGGRDIIDINALPNRTNLQSELPTGMPSEAIKLEHLATPSPESTPASETKSLEENFQLAGATKIYFNQEQLPIKYVKEDGKQIDFDIKRVKEIRDRAIYLREPEILSVIIDEEVGGEKIDKELATYPYTAEHPKTTELPEDVLSKEDLEKRGVKIIEAADTNLYIREGAFAKDAPLADFNNTGRELTIVLVDGGEASKRSMNDPKNAALWDLVPELNNRGISKYKAGKIDSLNRELGTARLELKQQIELKRQKKTESADERIRRLQTQDYIFSLKTIMYEFKNVMTNDQIFTHKFVRAEYAGKYFGRDKDREVIFLKVGEPVQRGFRETIIFSDLLGGFQIESTSYEGGGRSGLRPIANQTHLKPPSHVAPPPLLGSDYYAALDVGGTGFTLRHEIGHAQLRNENSSYVEYGADMKAVAGLKSAWEKWEKSGFTDNSGYHFVFSLPEGGYIITEHRQSNANTPSNT